MILFVWYLCPEHMRSPHARGDEQSRRADPQGSADSSCEYVHYSMRPSDRVIQTCGPAVTDLTRVIGQIY